MFIQIIRTTESKSKKKKANLNSESLIEYTFDNLKIREKKLFWKINSNTKKKQSGKILKIWKFEMERIEKKKVFYKNSNKIEKWTKKKQIEKLKIQNG